ncbi:unnamed protein product [Auanema sp. JU1783]|nr:unnamed protein product [Auanema sp. JU1783]
MQSSILLVFLVASASATFCPDGYKDFGDGECYGVRLGNKIDRASAYQKCQAEGSELATIENAFTNIAISSSLPIFDFIWLGITCTGLNNCYSDSGESLSYNNFYLTTNVSAAPFVYVDNLGMWGVGDYETLADGYVCRYRTSNVGCQRGYSGIEDRCYMPILSQLNATTADEACKKSGGRLASIKSERQNAFVHWLIHQQTNNSMAHLGFRPTSPINVNWTDNSVQTYSNLVYYDPGVGQCGAMSITNPIFLAGTWQSVDCSEDLVSICGADRSPAQVATAFTGALPATCLATYFINNSTSGRVTSPEYPMNVNLINRCHVVVSAPAGYKLVATSNDTNIKDGFLNVCDRYSPAAQCKRNPTSFTSNTGLIYIEFISKGGSSKWSLNYTASPL